MPRPKPKEQDVGIEIKPVKKFFGSSSFADIIADQERRSKNLGNQTYNASIEKT